MNNVLLTVSGTIPANLENQVAAGDRPLADYLAMARTFGADLLDYEEARATGGRFGRLLERVGGPNLLLAWRSFQVRHRYRAIFTDGEQVGLPLALLLKGSRRRPRHLMIGHLLSAPKKLPLLDLLRAHTHIDRFFVYATSQQRFVRERWQLPDAQVVFTPFMVDADFFAPEKATGAPLSIPIDRERPLICAVGLEFRDYPTLMEAVRGLDVQVVIAAASPWSKREDSTAGRALPENVIVHRFSQYELRELYALSRFVVVPLYPTLFQAGITTILEAMAMGKAVVCSRTEGQTDAVVEEETGRYVPPGDPAALRETIARLLQDPAAAERLGAAGRRRIEAEMSLERYVERLNRHVQEAVNGNGQ